MATLKDVAIRAGVNISTASRVLNGSGSISSVTADRVRKAAEELNYMPNASARILAGKQSNMVGIIVPEINSSYYAPLVDHLEARLQEKGYFLMIANTHLDAEKESSILEHFINYHVAGIFFTVVTDMSAILHFNSILQSNHIPLIALDVRLDAADIHRILVDDAAGIYEAVRFLHEKGHDEIGFLGDYSMNLVKRTDMFRLALERNGMKPLEENIYNHPEKRFAAAGYEDMKHFLSNDSYPAAYLAGYDDIAIGAMRAVYEAGLQIPEDIAIIGNDNGRSTDYLATRLTTIAPPVEKMAELGVNLMLNCINGKEDGVIHQLTLKPQLIIRESA